MKRHSVKTRLLSLILTVAMLATLAVPAVAVDTSNVKVTKLDNSAVSAELPGRQKAEKAEVESLYSDKDMVRVSIFLEKAGTLEAGYSAEDIAENAAAMNYRNKLEKDQDKLVQKIEKVIGIELKFNLVKPLFVLFDVTRFDFFIR